MAERVAISTPRAPAAVGPYGQAIRVGRLVFTVGVVGNDPATSALVPGGVQPELAQVFANMTSILDAAGSGLDRIVKATVYLADIGDEETLAKAWAAAVPAPHPAWTVVSVAGMPLGARVEIECIALSPAAE